MTILSAHMHTFANGQAKHTQMCLVLRGNDQQLARKENDMSAR